MANMFVKAGIAAKAPPLAFVPHIVMAIIREPRSRAGFAQTEKSGPERPLKWIYNGGNLRPIGAKPQMIIPLLDCELSFYNF